MKEDLQKLGAQMRADWDRRIAHDYRFWMSDGHSDDSAMWEAGDRDFEIITRGIDGTKSKSILEIGCGVGRLLRPALKAYAAVHGLDVSTRAIEKARTLLGAPSNLALHVGDGYSLPIPDRTIDVVFSFAAMVSMPTEVTVQYLIESHRVLKYGADLRIQIYLGKEQVVGKNDTLHLRCYDKENFVKAVNAAGFDVLSIEDLVLPFQVSFKDQGLEAMIVSLRAADRTPADAQTVTKLLLPQGEAAETDLSADADLEYWMSVNYAKDLVERGDFAKAKETLQFAENFAKTTTIDVRDLLERIVQEIEKAETRVTKGDGVPNGMTSFVVQKETFEKNLVVLRKKFPTIAEKIELLSNHDEISITDTVEGPTIARKGMPLDHPQKPKSGGEKWAKGALQEKRLKDATSLIILGFAGGYHLETFLANTDRSLVVIEPDPKVLRAALSSRDLSLVLERIGGLYCGEEVPSDLSPQAELILRPQHQALFSEFCSTLKSAFYGVRGITALHPTIGVLGPLQGGTLPITAYTLRGLNELRQRTKEYDVSGFAPGFHLVDKFFGDKYRVAAVHGTYLEMVSHVVHESINEKPVDILICMAQAPFTGKTLTELRKKGVITVLWFMEDYLRFTYWKDVARYFDFVFTIQKGPCIEAIKAAGAGEVHYLPAACDPFIHAPVALTEEEKARWGSPISFVGAGYHNRQQMFAYMADMPFKIWGTEWPTCRPFNKMVQEEGRRLTPAEYVKIFNATDINVNLHSSAERDGVDPFGDFVNPRTFELASAGAFQLVDERTHLPELFTAGKDLVTFKDVGDLKEKIRYYLHHPEERARIAANARERVIREHTYVHRMKEMLAIIYNSKFEALKRKEDESPWSRMLVRSKPYDELAARCETAFKRGEEPNLDGLVADIVNGKGKLTETEQKLLFLFHVRKQIIRMKVGELGAQAPEEVRRGGL